jgi:hypothetical protein
MIELDMVYVSYFLSKGSRESIEQIFCLGLARQEKPRPPRKAARPGPAPVFSPVRTDPVWGRAQYGPVQPEGQTGPDHKQAVLDWTGLVWTSPFLLMVVIQIRYGSYQVTAKTVIRPYF